MQPGAITMQATKAVYDVLGERLRHADRYQPSHDDHYIKDELVQAAAAYLLGPSGLPLYPFGNVEAVRTCPRRLALVRSAALTIAEIERLDRAAARGDS